MKKKRFETKDEAMKYLRERGWGTEEFRPGLKLLGILDWVLSKVKK